MGTNVIDLAKRAWSTRSDLVGQIREIDEAAAGRAYTEDETAKVEALRADLADVDKRVSSHLEIAARGADIADATATMLGSLNREAPADDHRSIGRRFVEADGWEDYREHGFRGNFGIELDGMDFRTVTDVTNSATSGGVFQNPTRAPRIGQDFLDRRTFLIDLLPHGTTGDNSVEIIRDVSPLADVANKAVEVAEAGAKPQAGPTFELVTDPVRTIAVWANITRQAAADNNQVMSYLDNRLRYSVRRRADGQAINGNGSAPNLSGLLNRSGILSYAPGSAEDRAVSIRHGIRLMEDAESVPEIIVMNPADAELFDLTNYDADGLHAVPNVAGPGARTAWGLTQVRSTAIAAGTAMLLDPTVTMVWDRQAPTAYMTDSHASNFVSNILTLLLEARLALSLFDTSGVLEITFHD